MRELRDLTGHAHDTIRGRLKTLRPLPESNGRTKLYDSREALILIFDAGDVSNPHEQKSRLDRARAEAVEMQNAEKRGLLLDSHKVRDAMISVVQESRRRLLAMPRRLAPLITGQTNIAETERLLTDGVHDALQGIAESNLPSMGAAAEAHDL